MTTKDVLIRLGVSTDKKGVTGLTSIRKGLKNLGRMAMSAASGIVMLGTVLTGFSVNAAMGFDKAMADVSTIVDTSKVNMADFRKEIKALSLEMGKSPEELTKGLYQTISAGVGAGDAMEFLKLSTKAAIAGVAESREAVDLFTTVLNAYGMSAKEAGRVSDVAFESVRLGKTTFSELAASMGNVASIASQANISIEEMFGAVTTLTKAGIDTATASTYLKNSLVGIIKPSGEAAEAAKKYGIELNASALKNRGFIGVLDQIKEKTNGNVTAITELFPNIRGMSAVMALAGSSSEEFASILESLKVATGATGVAFEKMESSSAMKIEKALNAIKLVGLELGEKILPMIVEQIDKAGGASGVYKQMSEYVDRSVLAFRGLHVMAVATNHAFSSIVLSAAKLTEILSGIKDNKVLRGGLSIAAAAIPGGREMVNQMLGAMPNKNTASRNADIAQINFDKSKKNLASVFESYIDSAMEIAAENIRNKTPEKKITDNITEKVSGVIIDSQNKFTEALSNAFIKPLQSQNLSQSIILNSATVG